jgi:hypothetical protein
MWLTEIADKRPISHNFTKGGLVKPVHGLVLHIQEGTEEGTFSWFNSTKSKASSHFGNPKHGRLEQFVDTDDMAWTQKAGNTQWLSVENEGKAGDMLTGSQVLNVAKLMVWMNANLKVPLVLADNPAAFGLGYHSMGGKAWGHLACPGAPIIGQRTMIVSIAVLYYGLSTILGTEAALAL